MNAIFRWYIVITIYDKNILLPDFSVGFSILPFKNLVFVLVLFKFDVGSYSDF
jgi:hypothetical protein